MLKFYVTPLLITQLKSTRTLSAFCLPIGWTPFCNSNGSVGNKGHPAVVNRRKLDDLLPTFKRVRGVGERDRDNRCYVVCPEASSGGEALTACIQMSNELTGQLITRWGLGILKVSKKFCQIQQIFYVYILYSIKVAKISLSKHVNNWSNNIIDQKRV